MTSTAYKPNVVHVNCMHHQTPRCCSGEMKAIVLVLMQQNNSFGSPSGNNPQVDGIEKNKIHFSSPTRHLSSTPVKLLL